VPVLVGARARHLALAASANCARCFPWQTRSDSIDHEFDGAKWLCGFLEMAAAKQCLVYSFGSNNNFVFEHALLDVNPYCDVRVFDPTSSPPPDSREGRIQFDKLGLCGGNATSFKFNGDTMPCKSLQRIIANNNHALEVIDVLKIDVDGGEWDFIATTDWRQLRVGQLLMEIHIPGDVDAGRLIHDYITPIEEAGFSLFFMESVCQGCPGQLEMGFLHRRWRPGGRWADRVAIATSYEAHNAAAFKAFMISLRATGFMEDVIVFEQPAPRKEPHRPNLSVPFQFGARAVVGDPSQMLAFTEYAKILYLSAAGTTFTANPAPLFEACSPSALAQGCCAGADCSIFVTKPASFVLRHAAAPVTSLAELKSALAAQSTASLDVTPYISSTSSV
jgi:hypothetical protein